MPCTGQLQSLWNPVGCSGLAGGCVDGSPMPILPPGLCVVGWVSPVTLGSSRNSLESSGVSMCWEKASACPFPTSGKEKGRLYPRAGEKDT